MNSKLLTVVFCLFLFNVNVGASETSDALKPAYISLIQAYNQEINRLLEKSSKTAEELAQRAKLVKTLTTELTRIENLAKNYIPPEKKEKKK